MKPYLPVLMSVAAILTSCSYMSGATFRVHSPRPEEVRAILATVIEPHGFRPDDCGQEARGYEHTLCARLQTERKYPLDLFAYSDRDEYHVSLYVFLNPSSEQKAVIRKLVTDLSNEGVEMCLSSERSSGLSKAERRRLKEHCSDD